jgi:hypothetical protein
LAPVGSEKNREVVYDTEAGRKGEGTAEGEEKTDGAGGSCTGGGGVDIKHELCGWIVDDRAAVRWTAAGRRALQRFETVPRTVRPAW